MASRFPDKLLYGGGGGEIGPPGPGSGGDPLSLSSYGGFRQQQVLPGQISGQRRPDLSAVGKRSFTDFQHNNNNNNNNSNPLSLLHHQNHHALSIPQQRFQQQHSQQQQQQMNLLLQQQLLMRSVKQRTGGNYLGSSPISPIDLCSPTGISNNLHYNHLNNLNNNFNSSSSSSSSPRFGVPVYRQQPQFQQQHAPISLSNNTNNNIQTQLNPMNFIANPQTTQAQTQAQVKPDPDEDEDHKILNTLQELEKQLLNDDDDNEAGGENDDVSVITSSEWSEAFQGLVGSPDPTPTPTPNPAPSPNVISPSPTSSASSCCSTSASPAAAASLSSKQLISEAALAISDGRADAAAEIVGRLSQVGNPRGSSEQRVAHYMSHALRARASPSEHPPPVSELFSSEQMSAVFSLYDLSPCFKFGLLAANLVMLEAITGAIQEKRKVHIIDFEVGHGGQYVNLVRALSERQNGAVPEVRVTAVETEVGNAVTDAVREALVKLGERVGISVRFDAVSLKIAELTRESLGCEEGDALVVNLAFKLSRVPDESVSMENLRDALLRRVKGLGPRAVTLVEQEMNCNTAPFATRVGEAREYYGALFDSLEATLPRESPERARAEEALGRRAANAVACEGGERVERAEVFGKWRARMGMAGFEMKAISPAVAESMRARLNSARGGNPGFTVKEESGGVGFGWMGRTLTVASAWR